MYEPMQQHKTRAIPKVRNFLYPADVHSSIVLSQCYISNNMQIMLPATVNL